jgi:hypothetical protein
MKLKLHLLQVLVIVVVLSCGFVAGYTWPRSNTQRITEDDPRWDCRTQGNGICGEDLSDKRVREIVAYIEDCTLERARAEQCTIPCSGDADCQAKNGSRDSY